MTNIHSTVRAYARAHALLRPGPLVLAVSGGTDSTALCLLLAELREEFGLVLHVAHFDHRARPKSAAVDAAFVAELANHIGATLRVGRAGAPPKNEDDARNARYEFLRRVRHELGATAVATGHTRDDQAETVLLHMTRGAGLAGLAGMRPERDGIVRPLLTIGRADTVAVCAAAVITPRDDPTNRSLRFARNRIRHRVLPELAKLNPEITTAIARLADAAAPVADSAAQRAAATLDVAARPDSSSAGSPEGPPNVGVDSDPDALELDRLPAPAAGRTDVLVLWWERHTGQRLAARQRAALAKLAASTQGSRSLDLPGGRALREYATLRFVAPNRDESPNDGPMALERGRRADWHGWRFALDTDLDPAGDAEIAGDKGAVAHTAHIDGENVTIRARRPGDRMGGPQGAKVQDVFTDAKVAARERDSWPVVTADEAVVWIPGLTQPPRSGRAVLRALRARSTPTNGGGRSEVTLDNLEQVASLPEESPRGEERGRPRT